MKVFAKNRLFVQAQCAMKAMMMIMKKSRFQTNRFFLSASVTSANGSSVPADKSDRSIHAPEIRWHRDI